HAQNSDTIVQIDSGKLQGVIEDNVRIFRGIPYAQPPVGALRWRPPQQAVPWSGVRDSSRFGHACPQRVGIYPEWVDTHFTAVGKNEDCLTVNIWTPVKHSDEPLPVMFYIHGGNMQYGSGSVPLFDGRLLASQGVVLVTFNYRIGYLGRFAHPAMSRIQSSEPLVNYGVFDQIAALEWVQRNISAFGGNPDDVTIFGHSAGGVSVNFLMITPQSKGLFHKAIAQGSAILIDRTQHAFKRGPPGPVAQSREDMGIDFVEHFALKADSDEELLETLRALSWEPIVDYQTNKQVAFGPVVDGRVVVDHVARVFERGEQHDVPYIGGANNWEWNQIDGIPLIGKWFLGGELITGLSAEDLAPFDDQWTRIGLSQRWFAEGLFLTSTRYLGKQMANVRSPAWLYHVTYVQTNLRGEVPGAGHGIEVPFIFGHVREHPEWQRPRQMAGKAVTDEDLAWGQTVQSYWLNFAKTGDPNGPGLPDWPRYEPASDQVMEFGVTFKPRQGLYKDTLDYLEERALIRRQNSLQ
ncbi:MAG: carboxylesterase family protein, partial [Gammaproteobacteria bacterium]|nr:carboxylesterase family protein [Gammaproteobacteria bacterium]